MHGAPEVLKDDILLHMHVHQYSTGLFITRFICWCI